MSEEDNYAEAIRQHIATLKENLRQEEANVAKLKADQDRLKANIDKYEQERAELMKALAEAEAQEK
ncbi:hypothetical protein QOM21_00905 [Streptomyces sp. Pv4-95]|uniref:hypothetical protein n=1 Tax=Streptomyces sp. Pv4-95 TaxID=3049543 RepID=UPI0038913464